MLPFTVKIRAGLPPAEQVVFAVKRAVMSGGLRVGDRFPSVRTLSQELRINPNTAHRVVAQLVREGVLLATPAVGTTVATPPPGSKRDRAALLGPDLERLVVEARRLGLGLGEVQAAVGAHWRRLTFEK